MENITDYFLYILNQSGDVHIAESDFKQALIDDPELRHSYKEYCREVGNSEKNAFRDFCEEYISEKNSVWKHLDEEYE